MALSAASKPVLKEQEISDLAQTVHDNLWPYRIGDKAGYSLRNEGRLSALFAQKGFRFDPTPFQVPVGTLAPFSLESIARTVVRQIAAEVAPPRMGKRFASSVVAIEVGEGSLVRAFGRAMEPDRALDKLAADVVGKMGGPRKILGIPLIACPGAQAPSVSPS